MRCDRRFRKAAQLLAPGLIKSSIWAVRWRSWPVDWKFLETRWATYTEKAGIRPAAAAA
jgi:hypothetical protein